MQAGSGLFRRCGAVRFGAILPASQRHR